MKGKKRVIFALGALSAAVAVGGLVAACGGEAHVHNYGMWTLTTNPTCVSEGVETRVCSDCEEGTEGHFQTRSVNAIGHKYGAWEITTDPTCVDDGAEARVCTRCEEGTEGHTETRSVDATGHSYGAWEIMTAPTCLDDGVEMRVCTRCEEGTEGHTETRSVDASDVTGHVYGQWQLITEPTKESEGLLEKTCTLCEESKNGHIKQFILPVLDKDDLTYTDYWYENGVNCGELKVEHYQIVLDGQEFNFDVVIAKVPHNYGEWVVKTQPTMETPGRITLSCRICTSDNEGHTLYAELPALSDPNYTVTTKDPTCGADGVITYTIRIPLVENDKTRDVKFVIELPGEPATENHNYVWTLSKKPTTTEAGTIKQICSVCKGEANTTTLPALTAANAGDGKTYHYEETLAPKCEEGGFGVYRVQLEALQEADSDLITFEVELSSLGHNISYVKGDGVISLKCNRDDCDYVEEEMPFDSTIAAGAVGSATSTNLTTYAKNAVALTIGKTYLVTAQTAATQIHMFKFTLSSSYTSYTVTFTNCDSTKAVTTTNKAYFLYYAANASATPTGIGGYMNNTFMSAVPASYTLTGTYANGNFKDFTVVTTVKTGLMSFGVIFNGSATAPHYVLMRITVNY